MTRPKRLSALDKERIAFTHDRLVRATELALFARRMGRVSRKTLETIAALKADHERAIEGRKVPAFDALGGRGKWNARKEAA
jgi:hypothetical protein